MRIPWDYAGIVSSTRKSTLKTDFRVMVYGRTVAFFFFVMVPYKRNVILLGATTKISFYDLNPKPLNPNP